MPWRERVKRQFSSKFLQPESHQIEIPAAVRPGRILSATGTGGKEAAVTGTLGSVPLRGGSHPWLPVNAASQPRVPNQPCAPSRNTQTLGGEDESVKL